MKNCTLGWPALFFQSILNTRLQNYLSEFAALLQKWEENNNSKESLRWQKQLAQLPSLDAPYLEITDLITLQSKTKLSDPEIHKTTAVLQNFMPWRKGPFQFADIFIDTEWRSDFKWQRILPHLPSLQNASVLDVGCGSGYHLFRMHEDGAAQVIGIDPTTLFFYQFQCFKQYLPSKNIHFLPLGIESLPPTQYFDVVFSMGVLYHRQDPIKFLKELKQQMSQTGTLVLETLVCDGDENTVLVPSERYAQMRNIWFIPSVAALILWLQRVGFKNCKCVDIDITSLKEQRSTQWMTNHSLIDFLDPNDHSKTIEGYPAPKRAVVTANLR